MNDSLIIAVFTFMIGASYGSFLYTFFIRYTNGTYNANPLKALTYPSHCQHCKEKIKPLYLIPVIGFLLAKGRCSKCNSQISFVYPLTETVCGCVAVACMYAFALPVATVYFFAITTSVCIAIIDQVKMEIPNVLVGIICITALFNCALEGSFKLHLYGGAVMAAVFIIPLVLVRGSFGGGDIKLAAAQGLFLGIPNTIVALEIALVSGAVYGIGYAMLKSKTLKARIPFGPFLVLGFVTAILYGDEIIQIYFLLL